ncbi:hypothetical protein MNBD_BACTEROID05-774, partial [hydrothermal vent metagenome]
MQNSNTPKKNSSNKRPSNKNNPKNQNNNWFFWATLGFIFLIFLSQSNPMTTVNAPNQLT